MSDGGDTCRDVADRRPLGRLRGVDDVLDPRSRHNLHVTRAAVLDTVGP